jgi:hypothetical protein
MLEIRESMQGLFGNRYNNLIAPYIQAIFHCQTAHPEWSKMQCALDVCRYTAENIDDGVGLGLAIAATVEECDR